MSAEFKPTAVHILLNALGAVGCPGYFYGTYGIKAVVVAFAAAKDLPARVLILIATTKKKAAY
jgi:hypothetical protein